MSSRKREAVKVVIINTEYVETDAENFKSVVQRLTGKDATVKGDEFSSSKRQNRHRDEVKVCAGNSVLSKGMSFNDLDRLLMELPSFDELYPLWRD